MTADERDHERGIRELAADSFDELVSPGGVVVVDCWAGWCNACRDFEAVLVAAAHRHPAHTFARLDTEAEPDLAASLGVVNVPSLLVFRDGLMVSNQPGYRDGPGLDALIAGAQSLDLAEVKAAFVSG